MSAARLTLVVPPADAGVPVLELAERLAGAAGRKAVERGGAWLDRQRASQPGAPVMAGATLTICLPPAGGYPELELRPAAIAYEDEWLVALHKEAGWYVGATPWDAHGNVLAALRRLLAARDGITPPLHLAHQLDRDTSGVLLVSKSPAANRALQAAFAGSSVTKCYRCLCAGVPPWSELELRTGHGRAAGGRWRIYPADQIGQPLPAGGGRVREARGRFVLEQALTGAALLRVAPRTGRTHQIRLHLAHLGFPLLGDTRYGGPERYGAIKLPGHLLHAATLRLDHPITGAPLELSSPLPAIFERILGTR